MKLYAPFAHLTIPFHCGGHYTIAPPSDICVYVWHHATSLRCGIFFLFGLKYFLISSWTHELLRIVLLNFQRFGLFKLYFVIDFYFTSIVVTDHHLYIFNHLKFMRPILSNPAHGQF